jgi:hypothetical protein
MVTPSKDLKVKGLAKRRMAQLASKARVEGVSPEHYARRLIEQGLAIEEAAQSKTFREIMGSVRKPTLPMSDQEFDALVDQARTRHHARRTRGKR